MASTDEKVRVQVKKVEWSSEDMFEFSFTFLFDKFKQFYLLRIFPHFDASLSIYKPSLGLQALSTLPLATHSQCANGFTSSDSKSPPQLLSPPSDGVKKPYETALYQEVLIKWLATFTQAKNRGGIGSPLYS